MKMKMGGEQLYGTHPHFFIKTLTIDVWDKFPMLYLNQKIVNVIKDIRIQDSTPPLKDRIILFFQGLG